MRWGLGVFGGLIGTLCAVVAVLAGITAVVTLTMFAVMVWPLTIAVALLYAVHWVRNSRIRKKAREDAAELRAIIEADKQRQAIRDEMVWGPIRRGEDTRPTSLD